MTKETLTYTEASIIHFRFRLGPQDKLPHFPPEGKWSGLDEIEASALRKLRNHPEYLHETLRDTNGRVPVMLDAAVKSS